MAVNIALIVITCVVPFLVFVSSFLLLVRFSHPDDKNDALLPKFVVLFGISLAFLVILVVPLDVANARNFLRGASVIDVGLIWQIIIFLVSLWLLLLIPFAFWFYESDYEDPDGAEPDCYNGQFGTAFKYTLLTFIIFSIVLVLLYAFVNEAQVEVLQIVQSAALLRPSGDLVQTDDQVMCGKGAPDLVCRTQLLIWDISVTFPIYLLALISFLGGFLFSVFLGIGLVALPFDFVNQWRTRPVRLTLRQFQEQKIEIGNRAKELRMVGDELVNKKIAESEAGKKNKKGFFDRRKDKKLLRDFEEGVYLLQKEHEVLQVAFHLKGGNPIWYFFKLIIGLVGFVLSITWILHISLVVLPRHPPTMFLNDLFDALTFNGFALISVVAIAVFAFYLEWCAIIGAFRFGLRLPFFSRMYPMEIGGTYMNSFLINTWIILLCSFPAVQLVSESFKVYTRATDISLIFGNQVRNLTGFKEIYRHNVYTLIVLGCAFLTTIYMWIAPNDRANEIQKVISSVEKGKTPLKKGLGMEKI
eukprot:213014_1